jgi:hypothetical protein
MLPTSLVVVAAVASFLTSNEPLIVLAVAAGAIYLALLSGTLVVSPGHRSRRSTKRKVFCIGLSRTGTTSITVALHQLGFEAHHQCHALVDHDRHGKPCVGRFWADEIDAHADIAPATVFQELATLYPDARFVFTRRKPEAWGKAMVRFVTKHKLIFALPTPPVARMFTDIYGEGWANYTVEQWVSVYETHERKVDAAFASMPGRLLKLDITGGDGWQPLCGFLDESVPQGPFPHADVFELSAVTQVRWQVRRLCKRFGKLGLACLLMLFAVRPAVADHNQCERACRVANGDMNQRPGGASVLGAAGSWFEGGITGRRLYWSSPNECTCFATDGETEVAHSRVPRVHPFIETADQWHFQTKQVCGSDGKEYSSERSARRAGVQIVNCGQCSKCSTLASVDAMHRRDKTLTVRASLAGVAYLFAGQTLHRLIMRSGIVGFDGECAECWTAATQCNLASCGHLCLYGWTNPLSASSTTRNSSGTELNACMQCDEVHCSAYYLQACGANRRTAGVVSDISRPGGHVCKAARQDALKRGTPTSRE